MRERRAWKIGCRTTHTSVQGGASVRTRRYCEVVHERGDDKANGHGGGMSVRLEVGRVHTGRCAGGLREVAGLPGRDLDVCTTR
jgi:hypothetical protein